MSHRIERFTSTLRQCLADILIKDMNDPILKSVFITDVIVSPDLKKARVFVALSPLPGTGDEIDPDPDPDPDPDLDPGSGLELTIQRLTHARGFIKRALAGRMYLKYIPELEFIKD